MCNLSKYIFYSNKQNFVAFLFQIYYVSLGQSSYIECVVE